LPDAMIQRQPFPGPGLAIRILGNITKDRLEILREAERQIMLHVIDSKWVGHIHAMDSLKEGIHLQGYGQKDPLIEYKKESFDMFDILLADIRKNTVTLLYHAQIVEQKKEQASA